MKTRIHKHWQEFLAFQYESYITWKNMFACFDLKKGVEQFQSKNLSKNVPTYLIFCAEKGIRRRTEEDTL